MASGAPGVHHRLMTRFPRVLLGAAFFLAAAILAALGWLAFAVSDRPGDRFVGVVLMAAALLGGVTAGVLLGGRPARRLSLTASAGFVLAGAAVVIADAGDGRTFLADVLLLAGLPILLGLVTAVPALRR
jgi:hypothetical protein